jgi:hypothetical protein
MRKITFGLLLILAAVLIGSRVFFQTDELPKDIEIFKFEDWRYTVEDGLATLIEYKGNETILDIPENVDNLPVIALGNKLFRNNTHLIEVNIPDSVTTLGTSVFRGCSGLKKVNLPRNLTGIPAETFFFCSSLENVEIPDTVTWIGPYAFQNCSNLQSIIIPNTVTSIGTKAFANCSTLQNIEISKNLRSVGSGTFSETPWLIARSEEFVTVGNKILIKYNGNSEIVEIPVPISSIVDAFEGNSLLKEVILPKTLTSIGDHAFMNCVNLQKMEIPVGVTSIGSNAFSGCLNLPSPILPETLVNIGPNAFQQCLSFTEIVIPEKVKSIASGAFSYCSALTKVSLPVDIERIDDDAFADSSNLKLRVGYGTTAESYAIKNQILYTFLEEKNQDYTFQRSERGIEIFSYIGSIFNVIVPDAIDGQPIWKIGAGAFQRNSLVRSVVIPSSVKEIGNYSFSLMEDLEKVTIGDGLEKIGKEAFSNNFQLKDFTIQAMNTEIGEDAFRDCPNLKIIAPEGSTLAAKAKQLNATGKRDLIDIIDPGTVTITATILPVASTGEPPESSMQIDDEKLMKTADSKSDTEIILPIESTSEPLDYLINENEENLSITVNSDDENPEEFSADNSAEVQKYTTEETEEGLVITGYSGKNTTISLPVIISGIKVIGIGESAFKGKALTDISIPDGYIKIGESAIANLVNPAVITIPASVTEIAKNAFDGSKIIIRSNVGTTAEQYAKEHEIQFRVIIYE